MIQFHIGDKVQMGDGREAIVTHVFDKARGGMMLSLRVDGRQSYMRYADMVTLIACNHIACNPE